MAAPVRPEPPPLEDLIRGSRSLLELATAAGNACIENGDELKRLKKDNDATAVREELRIRIAWLDEEGLLKPGADGTFSHLLEIEVIADRVERAGSYPPIGHLAVLRGLLRPLGRFYEETTEVVELSRGTPIPIAMRPLNEKFLTTPSPVGTADQLLLLGGSGWHVFDFGADVTVPVQLDFSVRNRLEQLTWAQEERLPRVATIHPPLGKNGVEIAEEGDDWFFGVAPISWDLEFVLEQLRLAAAGGADIAVLPELCLPQAGFDELEATLAHSAKELPPLIVAGSAHVTDGSNGLHANEARIFLDGERIGHHRKINPYNLKTLPDGRRLKRSKSERLSDELKPIRIFSSTSTRMAVMICSDLISKLPVQLEDAQVNLLLVPALTPKTGSFNGDICKLASHCQGASVIVNADTSLYRGVLRRPFMVMAGVPRPRTREQSREYPRRFRGGPAVGLLDLNLPLRRAIRWL